MLGAGENKQNVPYGVTRGKPFGRLEEVLKLLTLWFSTDEPIDFDGKFWQVRNGGISLPAFTPRGPDLLVAGGPGKAMQYAAQIADGWVSYFPGSTAEEYAEQIAQFDRLATEAGRDPAGLTKLMLFAVVLGDDDDEVELLVNNAVIRWDSAALVPGPQAWARHGELNPIGDDLRTSGTSIPWSGRPDAAAYVAACPDRGRHDRPQCQAGRVWRVRSTIYLPFGGTGSLCGLPDVGGPAGVASEERGASQRASTRYSSRFGSRVRPQ